MEPLTPQMDLYPLMPPNDKKWGITQTGAEHSTITMREIWGLLPEMNGEI